jgi:hypothetical protein
MSARADRRLAIQERLEKIAAAHSGRLTPEAVIEDARDPDSPLHHEFNWDLEQAAYQHWVYTARRLISSVEIQITVHELTLAVPAWVHDPDRAGQQGYIAVDVLRTDRERALRQYQIECQYAIAALSRALAIGARYALGARALRVVIGRIEQLAAQVGLRAETKRSA